MLLPKFSLRFLLLAVAAISVVLFGGREFFQRRSFKNAKHNTRRVISCSFVGQGEAIVNSIERLTYRKRAKPLLAFCGIFVHPDRGGELWADWVVNHNEVDGFQIRMKSGGIERAKLNRIYGGHDGHIYFNAGLRCGDDAGQIPYDEVDALALTDGGESVTDWKKPVVYDMVPDSNGGATIVRRENTNR